MIGQFVKRDFRIKYRGSFLGYIWSLLGPILHAMVYYALIVLIRGGVSRQPLWLFGGIILYSFFRETLDGGMRYLVSNKSLIMKVYFPREIFAFSNMLAEADFLPAEYTCTNTPFVPLRFQYQLKPNFGTHGNRRSCEFSVSGWVISSVVLIQYTVMLECL